MLSKTASFKPRSCFCFSFSLFCRFGFLVFFRFFVAHLTHMIKNLERLLVHLHLSIMGTKCHKVLMQIVWEQFQNISSILPTDERKLFGLQEVCVFQIMAI